MGKKYQGRNAMKRRDFLKSMDEIAAWTLGNANTIHSK